MKAALLFVAASLALASCAPAAKAPPAAPAQIARPAPAPLSAPAPVPQAPAYDSWMDVPATPGTWRYEVTGNGPVAVFVSTANIGEFVLSCPRPGSPVGLWRAGTSRVPQVMTIRTETATRSFEVSQLEATNPYLAASIAASDPLLDAMALSKGRFAVEIAGLPALYLPSHAEVSRVIEDCR